MASAFWRGSRSETGSMKTNQPMGTYTKGSLFVRPSSSHSDFFLNALPASAPVGVPSKIAGVPATKTYLRPVE
jgi:hypothetical protein